MRLNITHLRLALAFACGAALFSAPAQVSVEAWKNGKPHQQMPTRTLAALADFKPAAAAPRGCVGWHRFKYADNDPTSTHADPSNLDSNKGIVNSSYQPYTELLDAMRALNTQAYPLTAYFDRR